MRAKIGRNSGALSGLPATLVNTWMPRAPSVVTARSISASAASTLFIGSAAMKVGKAVGMPAADLGQRVIGEPRQLRRLVRRRDQLERRIGEREHLLQVAELVEQGEPRIDVHQRLEPRKGGDRHVARDETLQARRDTPSA